MLKPLADYVVLTVEKEEQKTASGIILTSESKDKQAIANVFAVGPKVEELQVDDRVIYESYSGTKVKLDGEEYLVIQAKHILAKITK
jgi:chaperonin GroES